MFPRIIDPGEILSHGTSDPGPVAVIMELPTHSEVIGWTGTILSIATAFTGGFVMIYQRIQRARRDDRVEWMKLKQGSLQALLDQANQELAELREALAAESNKSEILTKQNREQLEQIIDLTRHIIRLGALIGGLPQRLGWGCRPSSLAAVTDSSIEALGQTVRCLEGLVEQLRQTTRVLGKLAQIELNETPKPDEMTEAAHGPVISGDTLSASVEAKPNVSGTPEHHERQD